MTLAFKGVLCHVFCFVFQIVQTTLNCIVSWCLFPGRIVSLVHVHLLFIKISRITGKVSLASLKLAFVRFWFRDVIQN